MSWALRSKGSVATGTGSITPGAPPTVAIGDWLFLYAGEFAGSNAAPDLTASGWTRISSITNGHAAAIYAKLAPSTSPAMPSLNYGSANYQFAYCESWSGGPASGSLSVGANDRAANAASDFQTGGLTPAGNNYLILYVGMRNKTSATDGETIQTWTAGGGTFGIGASAVPAGGSRCAWVAQHLVQGTATAFTLGAANTVTGSATDGNQTTQGFIVAIQPALSPVFTAAPSKTSSTASSATFSATTDQNCTLYAVAVAHGAAAPSVAQIKAGQDSTGVAALSSSNVALTGGTPGSITLSGLGTPGNFDCYFEPSSGTSGDGASASVLGVATSLNFSAGPTVNSANVDGFTLGYTPSATGTVYAVAMPKGATAPTPAQVRLGTAPGQLAQFSKACTAATADTLALTGLTLPVYDLYVIVSTGTADSAVAALLNQPKLPAAGRQYVTFATPLSSTSPFASALIQPPIVSGVILDILATTTGSGYAIIVGTAGDVEVDSGGDVSRDLIGFNLYVPGASSMVYTSDSTFAVNDQPPAFTGDPAAAFTYYLAAGVPVSVNLAPLMADPESDPVTWSEVTNVLAGWGLSLSSAGVITGTAPNQNQLSGSLTVQAADPWGGLTQITGQIVIGNVLIPAQIIGMLEAPAAILLQTFGLVEQGVNEASTSPTGTVLGASPPVNTLVPPGTVVTLSVSVFTAPTGGGGTGGTTPPPPPPISVGSTGAVPSRSGVNLTLNDLFHWWSSDLSASAAGDLDTVSLTDRGLQRVLRRLMTNPGDYAFNPGYGGGLRKMIGGKLDPAAIQSLIKSQMALEAVVEPNSATVTVTPFPNDPNSVAVSIGYTDAPSGMPVVLSFDMTPTPTTVQ